MKTQTGLQVKGRTLQDTYEINQLIAGSDYHAEFDSEFGCFTFPEEEDNYDALEKELSDLFNQHNIDARIEGLWYNEMPDVNPAGERF